MKGKVHFKTIFLKRAFTKDGGINLLINWGKKFDKWGMVPESKGNLSFRTKNGFIITGTGTVLGKLKTDDFVEVVKLENKKSEFVVFCNGKIIPSMESLFHGEIYKLRPEINAIFHTHDSLVLEAANKLKIPSTKKEEPGGSWQLVQEIKKILRGSGEINYLALKNHGIIALGKTITEAGKLIKLNHQKAKLKF